MYFPEYGCSTPAYPWSTGRKACFKAYTNATTFIDAVALCNAIGGRLPIPNSVQDLETLATAMVELSY